LANYADGVISKKQVNNIENNQGLRELHELKAHDLGQWVLMLNL
jgi:hypothetical protein